MTIKRSDIGLPREVVEQIESGKLADRINAHVAEGIALDEMRPHAVRYYVEWQRLSYAKTGAHLGISGERVRQIAEEIGIRSHLARAAQAARAKVRVATALTARAQRPRR